MANFLKRDIEFIGLTYKKELLKIIIINVVTTIGAAFGFILTKMPMVLIVGLLAIFGVNYFIYFTYSGRKAQLIKDRSDEFVHIISYFRIFIKNKNNVYQSFNKLLSYSSPWMKDKIEIMLNAIDSDKSIKPFTDFADRFDLPIARNVMISIYQMIEQGEVSEQLNQFTILFEQMSQTLNDERKDRKFRSFDMVSFMPIIGAGLITMALTFSMLSIVGDMVNVI